MGVSSSSAVGVSLRIFQHISGTYPQIPNQQVYEGIIFWNLGMPNYVLGVGGLISSWIVWVKNVGKTRLFGAEIVYSMVVAKKNFPFHWWDMLVAWRDTTLGW